MNTIGMIGGTMATDGQKIYSSLSAGRKVQKVEVETPMPTTAAEVLQNMEQSKADIEASAKELQRLSDMVTGHRLHFNVNSETNKVVVTVVDASTNEVIRQIPSEEVQKIQARMKHAIGVLFDEMI
ncbi:MAG: flagellar protein FlaG [Treponema sp.]|nr:flagellar protein FlaG [Spirochaetia bacterium]MDD7459953.1 flagellar protein FlaG [Spirochaetales bacterium]MDY5810401.1 flagellar protein FlaG [Treponema sp.]MEE1182424.1 flagellar protein FlaG [Treponema sp.]